MRRGGKMRKREENLQNSSVELSMTSSKIHKSHESGLQLEDASNINSSHKVKKKHRFRYPGGEHLEIESESLCLEQPKIRKIIVDLRPTLRQVMSPDDEEIEEMESSNMASKGLFSISSGYTEQTLKDMYHHDPVYPADSTEELRICLPSIPRNQGQTTALPMEHRLSLVAVRDDGILSCNPEPKSPPVCFPKVILSQRQLPKIPNDEQGTLKNMTTGWQGVEKLQLPISELVKVANGWGDSRHHTLINHVLCSLRGKKEHDTVRSMMAVENTYEEYAHNVPKIGYAGLNVRFTCAKRS
ncbi:uncharacterized protein RCH25_036160 [Pelodytes ibericus]